MKKPTILITNDDGIHAPGIKYLWQALKPIANLTIVAPATEQSAVGLGITLRNPLLLQKIVWPEEESVWSVSGTPADCVKMALKVVLQTKPDLVVSGINRGGNAGRNLFYSGTVAGTIEATLHNIPGVAFSCSNFMEPNYQQAKEYIPKIVEHVLNNPLPSGTILNVNFPDSKEDIKGFKFARQGKEYWAEDPDKRTHPAEGHSYYWLGCKLSEHVEHEDSDIVWLKQGYATAVPIYVGELTHHHFLKEHKEHFENLFFKPKLQPINILENTAQI